MNDKNMLLKILGSFTFLAILLASVKLDEVYDKNQHVSYRLVERTCDDYIEKYDFSQKHANFSELNQYKDHVEAHLETYNYRLLDSVVTEKLARVSPVGKEARKYLLLPGGWQSEIYDKCKSNQNKAFSDVLLDFGSDLKKQNVYLKS